MRSQGVLAVTITGLEASLIAEPIVPAKFSLFVYLGNDSLPFHLEFS